MEDEKKRITMLHGAGGTVMHDLVCKYIVKRFGGFNSEVPLEAMDDAAVVDNIVIKSDSHVVKPLFFPGGDIGRLSICGTVNDISALGAEPFALACGLVLEEGLAISDLERILDSMKETCKEANVGIFTGDTKVVEKGNLGGCIINMSGVGRRTAALDRNLQIVRHYRSQFKPRWTLDSNLSSGDNIILTGSIADHGLAVLSAQEGLSFRGTIASDVKPLNRMIQGLLKQVGGIVAMKDPTRGGLADATNEFSQKSKIGILLKENKIPIGRNVRAACEMLGLDPLEVGNEGKMIIGTVKEKAEEALDFLKSTPEGKESQIIGETTREFSGVAMQTIVGGKRIVARPLGDPIPRIC